MGREKRKVLAAGGKAHDGKAKKVKRRMKPDKALARAKGIPLSELRAKDAIPTSSKHHTYFEFVENKNKKKKLEIQTTHKRTPPPGFEFVPIGNPQLTEACKELSREKDAMIFIVAGNKAADDHDPLHAHMHRYGHHVRRAIVEEVQKAYSSFSTAGPVLSSDRPEPLPTDQRLYHEQANAVLRDLFPRIPNTDRHEILKHSFDLSQKDKPKDKDRPVGLSDDIPLLRRVQLAVLAHIRHNHTRYDRLLKETDWTTARKVIEPACLDTLVKWRGDEESGRDQLDEILHEVVVISDSEESDSEDETDDSSFDESDGGVKVAAVPEDAPTLQTVPAVRPQMSPKGKARAIMPHPEPGSARSKKQRGFKRYQAWQDRWQDAVQRNRGDDLQQEPARTAVQLPPEVPAGRQPGIQPYMESQTAQPQPNVVQPYMNMAPPREAAYPSSQRLRTPPSRDLSPQVTERFGNLIFESIEPVSPSQAPPSYTQPTLAQSSAYLVSSSHLPPEFPHGRPAPPQRVHSGPFSRDQEFPGGFIEVSHRHVSPRTYGTMQSGPSQAASSSRTRAFEPDDALNERPAKRTYLGDAIQAPQRYIMKDRGGFLEKIRLPPEEPRGSAPDPGFIEIRRGTGNLRELGPNGSYDGRAIRHEPGLMANQSFPVVPSRHDATRSHRDLDQLDQYGRAYAAPDPRYAQLDPQQPYRTFHQNRYPNTQPFSPEYEPRLEPSAPIHARDGRPAGRYAHNPIVLD